MSGIFFVTGGSRGIGAAAARLAAERGYDVTLTYIGRKDAAETVVADIENLGRRAVAIQCDVADPVAIGAAFEVRLGQVWDQPIGPHPIPMYQIAFAAGQFAALVPFLMLARDGLSVLVHPETGDDVADHSAHALWLGTPLPLDLDILRRLTGG